MPLIPLMPLEDGSILVLSFRLHRSKNTSEIFLNALRTYICLIALLLAEASAHIEDTVYETLSSPPQLALSDLNRFTKSGLEKWTHYLVFQVQYSVGVKKMLKCETC